MSLQTRLVTALTVVILLVVGLGVGVVLLQQQRLIDQLDERLTSIAPLERPTTADPGAGAAGPVDPPPPRRPISDVYIATIEPGGTVVVSVQGQLIGNVVDPAAFTIVPDSRMFSTVDSEDGMESFRVLSEPTRDQAATTVIALSAADVNQTIRRLIITFALVTAAIALTLGALAWWVWRLSLVPIAKITSTAEAIANGDLSQRAPELAPGTEAGKMATALNAMLDHRDETDDRLRSFVSDASHELRTPLTSIQGYLEIYRAGGFREPGEMDDAVRRMSDESARMGGLVDNMLHLARMDEERPLEVSAIDVGDLVRDVCADMSTAHRDRSITADAPPPGQLIAHIDRNTIHQMLTGLVDNALVHGPEASVEVTARTEATDLCLVVADDGPGMAPEDASKVFDRFYRADTARSRARGGNGLGLAIAKQIVERHNGTITVSTSPGEGATFTANLPSPGRRPAAS